MPSLTVTFPGMVSFLDAIARTGGGLVVRLMGTNQIAGDGTLVSDFTEAQFPGYGAASVSLGLFGPAFLGPNYAQANYSLNPVSWPNTGSIPAVVYGYYCQGDQGHVTWYQVFDAPYKIEPQNRVFLDLYLAMIAGPFVPQFPPGD